MEAYNELPNLVKEHCSVFVISSTIDESDLARIKSDNNVTAFHEKPITKEFIEGIIIY